MTDTEIRDAIEGHSFTTENGGAYILHVVTAATQPLGQVLVRYAIDESHSGELLITADKYTATEVADQAEGTARKVLSGELPPGARELI